MAENKTKTRILDTAEKLFAEQGIGHTSLRQIIAAAKVNIAAIHYHIGSKEQLIYSVFERRIVPINEERLRLLEACEQAAGEGPLLLEKVIEALLRPPFAMSCQADGQGENMVRLMGRTLGEPNEAVRGIVMKLMSSTIMRFQQSFRRALPNLTPDEVFWRTHLGFGVMAHAMCSRHLIKAMMPQLSVIEDPEAMLQSVIAFIAAGMRGPCPAPTNSSSLVA